MTQARKKDTAVPVPGDKERHDQNHMWRRRLDRINAELARYGLPLLTTLGNHLDGEDEITGLLGIHGYGASKENPQPYYYIVTFMCKRPDGHERPYAMRVNAKHLLLPGEEGAVAVTGAACVTTFNGEWMIFIRQHRPTLRAWTVEVPRGYIPAGGLTFARLPSPREFSPVNMDLTNASTKDLPLGIVKDELGSFLRRREIIAEKLTLLAIPPEDTGLSPNITPVFHLALRGDPSFVTNLTVWDEALGTRVVGPPHRQVVFAPLKRIHKDWRKVGVNSHHCLASLFLYLEHAP